MSHFKRFKSYIVDKQTDKQTNTPAQRNTTENIPSRYAMAALVVKILNGDKKARLVHIVRLALMTSNCCRCAIRSTQ